MQVDLLIDRSDGIIDLCEIKNYNDTFSISADYAAQLEKRCSIFRSVTGTKKAIHTVLITTEGLSQGQNTDVVQMEVTLDDLFKC